MTEPRCRFSEAGEKNLPKCKKGTEGNKKEKSPNQKAEATGCAVSEESPSVKPGSPNVPYRVQSVTSGDSAPPKRQDIAAVTVLMPCPSVVLALNK